MVDILYNYYRFGSASSNDIDILIDHPQALGAESDKELYQNLKRKFPEIAHWDINIIQIDNGKITKSIPSKGSIDAVHNSLADTYALHKQAHAFPLIGRQKRNILLAIIKCTKTLLTIFKITKRKEYYKHDLRPIVINGNFEQILNKINQLNFSESLFDDPQRNLDTYKSLIFRVGQTISLINGIEVYTKEDFKKYYPDLANIIDRKIIDIVPLFSKYLNLLTEEIKFLGIKQTLKNVIQYDETEIDFRTEKNITNS
ncbi:hypothetical protein CA265_00550 [Sphingobacteriaceae bacterium GW460-11-11-14-LB5]|nr:hypothetical protein CA265_00550 [Sphingobacteriaceae bacterium GW460-11-11-14-LB5]